MKSALLCSLIAFGCILSSCNSNKISQSKEEVPMELSNTEKVVALLNSFNTGDQTPISYINPEKYIQHNLGVGDGLVGFGEVMQNAPEGGFKANVIRAFEDGNYVVAHTEYEFFGPKAAFDVFRFEDGKIVEHWDNLTEVMPPNPSGRTQFDGVADLTDLDKTEANKKVVEQFIDEVLLNGKMDNLTTLVNPTHYIQHNSGVADGLDGQEMVDTLNNIHPGEVLLEEFLKPMEITAYRLAKETFIPQTRISAIIKGKRRMTADTALRLSKFFGTSAKFWLGLQADYDLEEEGKSNHDELQSIIQYAS
jgi:addiction module HigA family antidote